MSILLFWAFIGDSVVKVSYVAPGKARTQRRHLVDGEVPLDSGLRRNDAYQVLGRFLDKIQLKIYSLHYLLRSKLVISSYSSLVNSPAA